MGKEAPGGSAFAEAAAAAVYGRHRGELPESPAAPAWPPVRSRVPPGQSGGERRRLTWRTGRDPEQRPGAAGRGLEKKEKSGEIWRKTLIGFRGLVLLTIMTRNVCT